MPELARSAFSYRDDPAVPAFDDSKPLFLFDGVCVLCSSGASFVMRHDRRHAIALASAQSPLGMALYQHYGLALDDSYLFLLGGRAFTKSRGYLEVARALGGRWQAWRSFALVPEFVRDWAYDIVARNRYRWFGKTEFCTLLTKGQRDRLLD